MPANLWTNVPINRENFEKPPREYGILPFWFLNGELDPDEMRYQLREFREKGMPGIILHARYGLEMPYLGEKYVERIRFAVKEAQRLGLHTWIYDEMNWPSGTADKAVLKARPDLAQRYIECLSFQVRGPWFTYLTGADSRYIDFERSTPLAAFAISETGDVIDLTPNLSFEDVIPWEVPPGVWRLMYMVEKEADYYIDAINPEATAEFLKRGYDPYLPAARAHMPNGMVGFYTDEPAMHYYVTGANNPIIPWTKDMLRRFHARTGYNLRPLLPHLFFDINNDSARVRYDFYNALTEFYSAAYYQQIHEWCQQHDVLFTGHLLYEEWLRQMIRVEGNPFKHYRHMDVIGVDHLYPIIGTRDRPAEHVAMKLASSAAHQYNSPRLLCESFGGIFMDTTMQRMKWILDWEYVLGVNLVNPHGFHYTLEGARKRDWPPSMFYQYPWWRCYGAFSEYVSRLSHLLSGGRHVAKAAVLFPINAMFANYTPQTPTPLSDRIVGDFDALTDLLLRIHYDYDYLDEDLFASAELADKTITLADEGYEVLIIPPMTHIKLSTLERIETFVSQGGRVLGMVFLPDRAFTDDGLIDVAERVQALFGVSPLETQREHRSKTDLNVITTDHGAGKAAFLQTYGIGRLLPLRLQRALDRVGDASGVHVSIEGDDQTRYIYAPPNGERDDITAEVAQERAAVADVLWSVLNDLAAPDVVIDNPEVFYLHRLKDERDIYFITNPTFSEQTARVTLSTPCQPVLWDPSTSREMPITPIRVEDDRTSFTLTLPPTGSAFVLTELLGAVYVSDTNLTIDRIDGTQVTGYGRGENGYVEITTQATGERARLEQTCPPAPVPLTLDGEWTFTREDANALVICEWLATEEGENADLAVYAAPTLDTKAWLPMVPGAWAYQLPAEPDRAYPLPVWYRVRFEADHVPDDLHLIIDGFAGAEWSLYVNGQAVTAVPTRSAIDSQMQAVRIAPHVQQGANIIAVRIVVTNATDGLLDNVKLMGDFALHTGEQGRQRLIAPTTTIQPASWTTQGYPYYSGTGIYRRTFTLPAEFEGMRIIIDTPMIDDVLEVRVNGQSAGVRLWTPYTIEITDLLQAGENMLELYVANTLVNLLNAEPRASGISGAPKLIPHHRFTFSLNEVEVTDAPTQTEQTS